MIKYIKGILTEVDIDNIVIECSGVGYEINVPLSVREELPELGTLLKVYTYHLVKEDAEALFGFLYKEDLSMFETLIAINGVGPKAGLNILSVLSADDLRMAIITMDTNSICKAQGVGKKLAERIILELKDKMGSFNDELLKNVTAERNVKNSHSSVSKGRVSEAIEALTALGYSPVEAGKAVSKVELSEEMRVEDILKSALRHVRQ